MEISVSELYKRFDEWFVEHPVPENFNKVFFAELISQFGFDWIIPNPHYDYECADGNIENPDNYCWNDQIDYYLCCFGGTGGWNTALHEAAKKCDYKQLITYYDKLDWYASDLFDGKLADLITADINTISDAIKKEEHSSTEDS